MGFSSWKLAQFQGHLPFIFTRALLISQTHKLISGSRGTFDRRESLRSLSIVMCDREQVERQHSVNDIVAALDGHNTRV